MRGEVASETSYLHRTPSIGLRHSQRTVPQCSLSRPMPLTASTFRPGMFHTLMRPPPTSSPRRRPYTRWRHSQRSGRRCSPRKMTRSRSTTCRCHTLSMRSSRLRRSTRSCMRYTTRRPRRRRNLLGIQCNSESLRGRRSRPRTYRNSRRPGPIPFPRRTPSTWPRLSLSRSQQSSLDSFR